MNVFKGKNTDWHAIIQTFASSTNNTTSNTSNSTSSDQPDYTYIMKELANSSKTYRWPTKEEMFASAYLCLSRGARSIISFCYGTKLDSSEKIYGLLKKDFDPNGKRDEQEVYYEFGSASPFKYVSDLFSELDVIKDLFTKIDVDMAYTATNENGTRPSNAYVTIDNGQWIEVGEFHDRVNTNSTDKYLLLVNRVCNNSDATPANAQTITVNIPESSKRRAIEDIYTLRAHPELNPYIILEPGQNSFSLTIGPGRGKLLRVTEDEQAILLGWAYDNKSQSAKATYANNARHLVKDGGYLYEIFSSGGEIYFRRSNNNGSSWQVTKRLTAGNGSNSRPAISAFYDNSLHVVWQRKIADNKWDIYYTYSTNHGNSWHSPSIMAHNVITSTYQNNGPQPVIAYSFVQEQLMELMAVYTTSNGLYYTTKTSASGSWATPVHISGCSHENFIRFPSLSGNWGYFALVYDTRYYGVYSKTFDGSWSDETRFDWAGNYDRETCVAMEKEGGSMLAAYVARPNTSSPYSLYFRKGYENNTWSDFKWRFNEINHKDYRRPTLTYFDANYSNPFAISIIVHTSANRVVMIKYYGQYNSWQENHIAYNGREVQITGYAYDAPKYCWTDQSASPYLVKLSSTFLPKTAQPTEYKDIYARNAVIANSLDGTAQVLEVSDYIVHTKSGKEYRIAFQKYPDDTTKLTMENIWNYMDSEPVKLPEDAMDLSYSKNIYTVFPHDSTKNQSNTTVFTSTEYQLVIADAQTKAPLSVIDKETKSGEVTVNISDFAGRKVILYPSLQVQLSDKAELHFELTNIFRPVNDKTEKLEAQNSYIAQSDIPANIELFSNYPNPFNPITTIRFALPKDAIITLTVFDLSGKKVKTLVNGFNKAGYHQVQWNGKDDQGRAVASGMYFYVLKTGPITKVRKMFLLR